MTRFFNYWSKSLAVSVLAASVSSMAVAQTSAELEQLQRQVEELQRELERLRDDLEQSETDTGPPIVDSGNDRVKLSISGHVNRGLLITDDGNSIDVFHVDNDNSSTRLRLIGEAKASDDLTVGTNIEVQFASNSTSAVNQKEERNVGPDNFTQRKLELFFDSQTFGKLSLGQGDTATNGTSEVDLSGTEIVGYSGVADLAGGLLFRDGDDLTDITIGSTFNNLDGLSRDDRLRYDTPNWQGLSLSGSLIADERWDLAARYSRDFSGIKVASAVSYADAPDEFDQVNGSASMLLPSGLNLTLAGGARDFDDRGDEGVFYYAKLGYQADFFEIGKTAFAVDFYVGEDIGADGDEANSYGIFLVQHVPRFATELYAGYRHYDLDRNDLDLEAVDAILTGARVKF